MKNKLKEFIPLWNFVKNDKIKIIIASINIFLVEMICILNGYLNGMAIESVTNNKLKLSLIYLGIYLVIGIVFDAILYEFAQSELQKVESKITRKLGYNTYIKALNLPAYAYEKTSSGEIINRINNDADTLSFAFLHILNKVRATKLAFIFFIMPEYSICHSRGTPTKIPTLPRHNASMMSGPCNVSQMMIPSPCRIGIMTVPINGNT